jgi:CubicO group peptidase (beta-lactamase class C family)
MLALKMKRTITFMLLLLCLATCKENPGKTKAERIDFLMQEFYADKEFIGSVLVADHGEIIYKRAFGNALQEKGIQNTDTTKFLIASVSKPITAILILRLVDQGSLKLDATIDKYFTNLSPEIGRISIHQLLTHTSGINEIVNEEEEWTSRRYSRRRP